MTKVYSLRKNGTRVLMKYKNRKEYRFHETMSILARGSHLAEKARLKKEKTIRRNK